MLQTKNLAHGGRNGSGSGLGRPPPGKRRALLVASAGRWTLGSIFDAITGSSFKQIPHQTTPNSSPRLMAKSEQIRLALPPTFERLSPELVVLLDPKHDRLVYLLSVDEASSADAIAGQLRGLLRATAAPYVHLMAMTSGLRSELLRKLPGGRPIVSSVPLPAELATALQQQQRHGADGPPRESGVSLVPANGGGLAAERPASRQWAQGGVLELLYGASKLQPGGPAEGVATAAVSAATAGGLGTVCDGESAFEEGRDVADEVLSRGKKTEGLMGMRKGVSRRVARRRSEHTPYRFGWLIKGFNSPGELSVVAATSNMILIRNNVDANLEVDITQDEEELLAAIRNKLGGEDGDSDAEDGETATAGAASDDDDDDDDSELPEDMAAVLKAIGILDSDSDDDDGDDNGEVMLVSIDEDDELIADSDDDDELLADSDDDDELLADSDDDDELIADSDDDDELLADSDDDEEEDEEETEKDGDGMMPAALMSLLGRQTPYRQLLPGVFVRVNNEGEDDSEDNHKVEDSDDSDDDGDGDWSVPETLDVQLSPGPMGWTASLRLGREEREGGADGGADAARREALRVSLQADAEYLTNMGRLEALWDKQARNDSSQPESGQQQGQGQGEESEKGGQTPSPSSQKGTGADGVREGSLEADWRQAESLAAASATTSDRGPGSFPLGTGVGAAAARGAVPTDRLMGAPRRPGNAATTANGDAGSEGAEGNRSAGDNGEACGLPLLSTASQAPVSGPSAAPTQDDFVASTRSRRGAAVDGSGTNGVNGSFVGKNEDDGMTAKAVPSDDEEDDADTGADGQVASARPTGRSRMVRRPRLRLRPSARPLPGPSGRETEAGVAQDAGGGSPAAAPAPLETSASSDAAKGSVAPSSASAAMPNAGNSSSSSHSSAEGAKAIPAYRHMRHANGSGFANGSDAAVGNSIRPSWSRTGPAMPAPQGAGGAANGGGAAAGGLPPEAAGYAALDLEQLAQFVLGRQASPEEVQDLARAVAQSAEVEEAFGSLAGQQQQSPQWGPQPPHGQQQQQHGPLGFGSLSARRPWRRPGTPPPSVREVLGVARSRRSVVTPRRRRLRIPQQVMRLAAQRWPQAQKQGRPIALGSVTAEPDSDAPGPVAERPAPAGRPRLLSGLMLRRIGGKGLANAVAPPAVQPAGAMQQQQQPQAVSQEELAAAMVGALREAPPLQRQGAETLVAFLRGRRHQQHEQQQRQIAEVLRNRTGLPGLVRGRDAVVLLPRALLEATVGVWHEQEQLLLHEDYRIGRVGV